MKRRKQVQENADSNTMRLAKHLKVGCAKAKYVANDDKGIPGLIGRNVPSPPDCADASFSLFQGIIRCGAIFCSYECAHFGQVWITQLKKLAKAEASIVVSENCWELNDFTSLCERCEYNAISYYWNPLLFGNLPGNMGALCALCALTLTTNKERQARWITLPGEEDLVIISGRSLSKRQRRQLPDGWQQYVFGNNNLYGECCNRGANCFGLKWSPQFGHNKFAAFTKTADADNVYHSVAVWCTACMEADDCQTRKTWWSKICPEVRAILVENGPLITPLIDIVATFLVSVYD